MVFPILAGVGYALLAGEAPTTAAFVGLALAATSIGITSRVLSDLGVLDRRFSRIIIGAAVIDDILALILIGVVSGAASGDLGLATLGLVVGGIGFVVLGFAIARRARGLRREVFTWPLFADTPLVPVFLIMLALAILSALIGLAAIIGAFVAGLIIAETEAQDEIEHEIRPLGQIITPFFFAVTGAQLDLSALLDPALAVGAVMLAVLGIATKALAGRSAPGARDDGAPSPWAWAWRRGGRWGSWSSASASASASSPPSASASCSSVVLTTIAAPIMLNLVIPRADAESAAEPGAAGA